MADDFTLVDAIDEATVDLLVGVCPSFPGFSYEKDSERKTHTEISELAHHIIDNLKCSGRKDENVLKEVRDVFGKVEQILLGEIQGDQGLVVYGFLEDLQNIISHVDVEAELSDIEPFLGQVTLKAWNHVNELVLGVLKIVEKKGEPSAINDEKYCSIDSAQLKKYVQAMTRRISKERYISTAQILKYEREVRSQE